MKTIILLALFGLLLVVASSNAKNLDDDNDDDMELTAKRARMFLRTLEDAADGDNNNADDGDDDGDDGDDNTVVSSRQAGKNCVRCKLGLGLCCAPNFCRKKFLRPNECVEVKVGK